jgi:hypothetical protein
MSLRKFRPLGAPAEWRLAIWPGFEICVVRLVCEACVRLRNDERRRPEWEERQYSWAVVRHLEQLCREQNLSLSPRYDSQELSDEQFAAGASPKSVPLLDVCVRWHQHIPEVRFAIEAKILVARTYGSHRPKRCSENYVKDGMRRFLQERYAKGMPAGAMLGYILDGTVEGILPGIEREIKTQRLDSSEAMGCGQSAFEGVVHFQTKHYLFGETPLRLHHIFVEQVAVQESRT